MGRAWGRRGPHRGGSVKPSPFRYRGERNWFTLALDAFIFTVLFVTLLIVLSPIGTALWVHLTRGRA